MKKQLTKTSALLHSGLYGDCSGLYGDFDDCEITAEDRANGVDIALLVA